MDPRSTIRWKGDTAVDYNPANSVHIIPYTEYMALRSALLRTLRSERKNNVKRTMVTIDCKAVSYGFFFR